MNLVGLSTDQAPPISAPLRFFLTAPLFGVVAGFLILLSDPASFMSRYSSESIALTHLITIGFFSSVMFGALTQMLPVLAGAKINKVEFVTRHSHELLILGLIMMVLGLVQHSSTFMLVAFASLGSAFFMMILSILNAIKNIEHITATIRGMQTSMFFAFIISAMGLFLLYDYVSNEHGVYHYVIANIHSVLAIFGFAGILIIGVAFQVLPMFYVAPKFKNFCKKYVVKIISVGLFIWFVLNFFYDEYAFLAKMWIALFFWAFATTVWIKFNKRKRPISDITVWYCRSASVFLTLGSFVWIGSEFFKDEYIILSSILIGGGFIMSILIGMLYKIIPFLVWFHLNAMGYMSIPTMNEMIDKKLSKVQFITFILSLVGFIFAFYIDGILVFAASSFILSMILLEYNIIAPVLVYIKTKKTKPDFDMSMFNN